MCTCVALCCCTAFLIAAITSVFALLLVPTLEDAAFTATQVHAEGKAYYVLNTALTLRHFAFCLGDYLGCVKNEIKDDLAMVYGWQEGVGLYSMPSAGWNHQSGTGMPIFFSHAAYKSVAYDPAAARPADMMVGSNKSHLPPGVMPEGVDRILLNFNTGTPEHTARRALLAAALPALAANHRADGADGAHGALLVPPGVQPSDAAVFGPQLLGLRLLGFKKAVFGMVGLNLFHQLFGADIADELPLHFEYDTAFAPVVLGAPIAAFGAKRLSEIRQKIYQKVVNSPGGKKFIAVAKERGMPGEQRLSEMVWIAMFAGYGGTSNLAFETLKHILQDPKKYVPLFRANVDAFMLEAARLFPPVGGMNPITFNNVTKFQFRTGRTIEVHPGDLGFIFTSNANRDPTLFEDPDSFRPGRSNADRLLSWNAELRDIRSCPTAAGCPAAPRGCPGTHLSLRVATGVVRFFVDGLEAALKEKNEL